MHLKMNLNVRPNSSKTEIRSEGAESVQIFIYYLVFGYVCDFNKTAMADFYISMFLISDIAKLG